MPKTPEEAVDEFTESYKNYHKITEFIDNENVPFINRDIADTMKSIMRTFRDSGHIVSVLKVTKDEISVKSKTNNETFAISWNNVTECFFVGIIDDFRNYPAYLYRGKNAQKEQADQTVRDMFQYFKARLDFRRVELALANKYPDLRYL